MSVQKIFNTIHVHKNVVHIYNIATSKQGQKLGNTKIWLKTKTTKIQTKHYMDN